MQTEIEDARMRCRVMPQKNGDTRVIIDVPTEPAYMRRVMAAISGLTMNRFPASDNTARRVLTHRRHKTATADAVA